jgi:molybdopterin/thiamine biosynthesis adenylyltransferase
MSERTTKNVTVVGVGALGSHLVQFLRSEDVSIKVIDFDRVEQKNVKSQFHGITSVGKKKTESLKMTMNFLYKLKLNALPFKLTRDNDHQLLLGSDLIIDCLDNGDARRDVQWYARAHRIPLLHGALAADGGFGQVIWDEGFEIDDEPSTGAPTCENGEFLPFIGITSAYLARAVQIYLRDGVKHGFSISPGGTFRS